VTVRPALALLTTALAAGCMKPDLHGAKLDLADARLEILQKDGARHVVMMTRQGVLAFDGEVFATIGTYGDLRAHGVETAKLEKDGVLWAQGVRSNVEIRPDGALVMNGEVELEFTTDQSVHGSLFKTMNDPRLDPAGGRVLYVGPPEARRALMTGFAAFLTRTPLEPPPAK
jgi:hypothetical protein